MSIQNLDDAMLKAVAIISDKKIDKAQIASTIQGTVIECKDEANNKYLIQYQDSKIEAYGQKGTRYSNGTRVYIYIPDGKISSQYKVILGSPNQLATDNIEGYNGEEFYDTGQNFITTDNFKIKMVSNYTTQRFLYIKGNEQNRIKLSDNINGIIKNTNYLKLSGIVQTNLTNKQKRYGRYGIKVSLLIKNSATGNDEIQDFYFDSNNFEGNPYQFNTSSHQEVYWPIDSVNFVEVHSISFFTQDFPEQTIPVPELEKNWAPTDILITNFSINGSYQLNEAERTSVGVILKMPNGSTFGKDADDKDTRLIEAELRVSMRRVDSSDPNLKVYWFKQDAGISSTSLYFSTIGGLGWKCLNEHVKQLNIIDEGTQNERTIEEETPQLIPSVSIEIPLLEVKYSQQTLFRCIVMYGGKKYSRDFTILNKGAQFEVTLESSEGTSFKYSAGNPTLTCRVFQTKDGQKQEVTEDPSYVYRWQVRNNQNITTVLEENTDYGIRYKKAHELMGFLWDERRETSQWQDFMNPDEENISPDTKAKRIECYEQTSNKLPSEEGGVLLTYSYFYKQFQDILDWYDKQKQQVQENVLYNVDLHQITKQSTFWCSCYKQDTQTKEIKYLVGTASITIENVQTPSEGYLLVINHGEQVFLYDEQGMSLHSAAIDEPYEIFDLTYTLYYNGRAIESQDLKNGVVPVWKVPKKDTMLIIDNKNTSLIQTDDFYICKGLETLSFDVSNTYNSSFTNNDIFLELEYNEQLFVTKTNFTFTKQGQNGTNGTKYCFKIELVDNSDNGIENGVIRIKSDENLRAIPKKFEIIPKFWYNGISETIKPNQVDWRILTNNLNKAPVKKYLNLDMSASDINSSEVNKKGELVKTQVISGEESPLSENINLDNENLEHIIEASCTHNGYKYYANLPVPIIKTYFGDDEESNPQGYKVSLRPGSGFRYVTYKSDGTQPKYDDRLPFEVVITKKNLLDVDVEIGNIPEEEEVSNFKSERFIYNWEVFPRKEEDALLKLKSIEGENNKRIAIPKSIFTKGNQVNNAIFISIKIKGENDEEIPFADIHIPIHFMLNKYQNRALNDWNGTSIEINETDGYILTPQVGAGKKNTHDNGENTFTGVILGIAASGNSEQTGLFAYGDGIRSIFLDAKTGNATFGKAGSGQIEIDVDSDKALITSSDYKDYYYNKEHPRPVTYDKNGIPTNLKNGQGMQIQFSNSDHGPHIYFGSGNFFVTKQGFMHTSSGQVAGWQIKQEMLYKENPLQEPKTDENGINVQKFLTGMSSTDTTHAFFAGTIDTDNKKHYNFFVDHDGTLFSNRGTIGGWTIKPDRLSNTSKGRQTGMSPGTTLNKGGGDSQLTGVTFWAGEASGNEESASNFHVSPNFYVLQNGYLFSNSGEIGGWKIGADGLTYSTEDVNKKVGLSATKSPYLWAKNDEGKTLFKVSDGGSLFAIYGQIGNWNIGENGLYQEPKNKSVPGQKYSNTGQNFGVYVGSDGIRLGDKFWVEPNGEIFAGNGGHIGNIKIANGGISHDNENPIWFIKGDGTAKFTNVTINGASVVDKMTASGNGGFYGGGGNSMTPSGTTFSPSNTTVGKDKFDTYIQNLIVKNLQAENFWAKVGRIRTLQVRSLDVGYGIRIDDNIFVDNNLHSFDYYDIESIKKRLSALEEKVK